MKAWLPCLALACALVSCRSRATGLAAEPEGRVRNVILLIGDGMGPQEVGLADLYARYSRTAEVPDRTLNIRALLNEGRIGLASTEPADALVNDSAGAATQIATARRSRPGMIGVDADGNPAATVLEKAKAAGLATGLVSTVRITDATPAAFAAHRPYRFLEAEIAEDLLASGPDVMLSGGLRSFLPRSVNDGGSPARERWSARVPAWFRLQSKRRDERDLTTEARNLGYEVVFDEGALRDTPSSKILGLFAPLAMPDALAVRREGKDREPGPVGAGNARLRSVPTLAEMTRKALEVLARDPEGFFLMVEGGQIDWAAHDNDTGALLAEMLGFDEAIGAVREFTRQRNDTLVVLTADHETGSFGFSYSRWALPPAMKLDGRALRGEPFQLEFNYGDLGVLEKLRAQGMSFGDLLEVFDERPPEERNAATLMSMVNEISEFPITPEEAAAVLATEPNQSYVASHRYLNEKTFPKIDDFEEFYVDPPRARASLLGRAIAREQGVVWATGTHTSTLVLVSATGPAHWTERFGGLYHQTEIGRALMDALGLDT